MKLKLNDLKMMVQENFKEVLKVVRSKKNVPEEDMEHAPVHDMEQDLLKVTSTHITQDVPRINFFFQYTYIYMPVQTIYI